MRARDSALAIRPTKLLSMDVTTFDPEKFDTEPDEFSVVRKGYDRGEVDSYCWRVTRAIVAMQEVLNRHQSASAESTPDMIARTLLVAQNSADEVVTKAESQAQTILKESQAAADLAINEAKDQASQILADADLAVNEAKDQASQILADAELDRLRINEEALTAVAEIEAVERERRREELARLTRYRDLLNADVKLLARFLGEKRANLIAIIDEFRELLVDPAEFRDSAPTLSGLEVSEGLPDSTIADDESLRSEVEGEVVDADAERPTADEATN